jgi:recombinational DNA repair protein (RecF pathway)
MNPVGLIWPVVLVAGLLLFLVQKMWELGLWPEQLVRHCAGCGEPIGPAEGGNVISSEFDGVFCSYDCLEEVEQEE